MRWKVNYSQNMPTKDPNIALSRRWWEKIASHIYFTFQNLANLLSVPDKINPKQIQSKLRIHWSSNTHRNKTFTREKGRSFFEDWARYIIRKSVDNLKLQVIRYTQYIKEQEEIKEISIFQFAKHLDKGVLALFFLALAQCC